MHPPPAEVLARVVKAYDVRGLVDTELDATLMYALGRAAAEVLAAPRFAVGWDMRDSSSRLAAAFIDGVRDHGVDVIEVGLASTDTVYYASGALDAAGAMVTASHNPPTDNGVKLCRPGAAPVSIDTGLAEIRDLAARSAPPPVAERGRLTRRDVTEAFAAHARSFVDPDALGTVHVVVDAGNGMAGHLWPRVVDGTPVVTTPLYFELDGRFPNHPADPLDPANLVDLAAEVRGVGADLGLAFDGDADRVFAVDEEGRTVSSSLVGAVVAERLLVDEPGGVVLHNLICSRAVPEAVRSAGGTAVRTRVGHSFIKAEMARTGAVYGVEHSGHHYFRDNFRADSGVIAALILLEAVAAVGGPLSRLVAPHDRYASSGEASLRVTDPAAALDEVAAAFADRGDVDHLDGLTVDTGPAWFNLRPSNTEPLLRLNVEGRDDSTMRRLRDDVLRVVADGR